MEYQSSPRRRQTEAWDAARLQALRRHLGLTQRQFADELGIRQQTISEWETGLHQPRGASRRLLTMLAEQADFEYTAEGSWSVERNALADERPGPNGDRD